MKYRVWCDSGANAHSKREEVVDTSDWGFSDAEWAALPEKEQEEHLKEAALAQFDWGYAPQ